MCLLSSCVKDKDVTIEIKKISMISELTLLEYKFNNVAVVDQLKGEGVKHLFEKDRKMFVEYEGVIKVGINMSELEQRGDTIIIPKSKVLSVYDIDGTYKTVATKDSILNKNRIEDAKIIEFVKSANKEMEDYVKNDEKTMILVQDLAELQIKSLVDSIYGKNNFRYEKK